MAERNCELDRFTVLDKMRRARDDLDRAIGTMERVHADHAYPTRSVEPTSGGSPSDPTLRAAATPDLALREYSRGVNKIRSIVGWILDDLGRAPRQPDTLCVNCRWQSATHPRGNPKRCEACDRYKRRNGIERPPDVIADAKERAAAADERRRRWAS